jgi:hypothetical protein
MFEGMYMIEKHCRVDSISAKVHGQEVARVGDVQ